MSLTIESDLGPALALAGSFLKPGVMDAMLVGIAAALRDACVQQVQSSTTARVQDYLAGLQIEVASGKATLSLVGAYPNMLENGTPGFDLRDTLLRPFGLAFRVIPIRHLTPGSVGRGGTPMGAQFGPEYGKKIGRHIYNHAKNLQPGQALRDGLVDHLKESHQRDLFAGMQKMKTGNKPSDVKYMTFRTITEEGAGESWMYPAKPGLKAIDAAAAKLPEIVESFLNAFLEGLGK